MSSNFLKFASSCVLAFTMMLFISSCKEKSVDAPAGPGQPNSPYPQDKATRQLNTSPLKWSCSSGSGDALTYDVYFGTTNPPTSTIATNLSQNTAVKAGLGNLTTYYWQVVAKDSKGATTTGPVWQFTTTIAGMVYIESGTFQMGISTMTDLEKPVHSVTLSNNYFIGQYEVTQKEWREVVTWKQGSATTPLDPAPTALQGDSIPVSNVSWVDVQTWLGYLNEKEGITNNAKKYRLPTEAEWEFAARGGIYTKGYTYSGSNTMDDVAWSFGTASGTLHAVGKKAPNEVGLYDMSGNVWEWCSDWFSAYTASAQTDPTGGSGSNRIIRGGCRASQGVANSAFYRDYAPPDMRWLTDTKGAPVKDMFGFRYVRTP